MAYEPRKAAQLLAAFLIKNGGNELDILKIIKLVYLADKKSIELSGFPILDEPRYSLPNGPLNSCTKDCIDGNPRNSVAEFDKAEWNKFIQDRKKKSHKVILANKSISIADLDELSDFDVECVNEIWNEFGSMSAHDLMLWTHDRNNVPEWQDPKGSRIEISLRNIMEALEQKGKLSNAESFAKENEAQKALDKIYSNVKLHVLFNSVETCK